jgi:hypothetical protein
VVGLVNTAEHSSSKRVPRFIDQLVDYQLLKKVSASWNQSKICGSLQICVDFAESHVFLESITYYISAII